MEDAILILTTGGTIDKEYFDAASCYEIGATMIPRLLEIGRVRRAFKVRDLMRKDSLDLTLSDREVILKAVVNSNHSKIIIVHGSDTMTQTAQYLQVITDRTIVLVGALLPARFSDSDAPFNLGMAFVAAQIAPAGVWITMNGTIFPADKVRKDRVAHAFVSTGRL
jgi:L-asparaginase